MRGRQRNRDQRRRAAAHGLLDDFIAAPRGRQDEARGQRCGLPAPSRRPACRAHCAGRHLRACSRSRPLHRTMRRHARRRCAAPSAWRGPQRGQRGKNRLRGSAACAATGGSGLASASRFSIPHSPQLDSATRVRTRSPSCSAPSPRGWRARSSHCSTSATARSVTVGAAAASPSLSAKPVAKSARSAGVAIITA